MPVNAFGVNTREPLDHTISGFTRTKLENPVVVANEDAPGTTKVIFEEIDLRSFIEEASKNCGLEYVLKLMKAGQIQPGDIADDGQHGVDATKVPSYIGDLKAQAEANAAQGEQLYKSLGLDPKKSYTDEELKAAVAAALQPYFATKEKEEGKE